MRVFKFADQDTVLFAARGGQSVKVKVVFFQGLAHTLFKVLDARDTDTQAAEDAFGPYLAKATELAAATKGKPKKKTADAADAQRLADVKKMQTDLVGLRNELIKQIQAMDCSVMLGGCFAAGTRLLTEDGWKNVEDVAVGDMLASRDERDAAGTVEYKRVEMTYVRTGRVLHLHTQGGELIRTTGEHPFFVEGEGWVEASSLKAGDRLVTADGVAVVEEAFDTGDYERVYNCRVADHHTYFVDDGAGAAVWAHNTYEFVSGRKVVKLVKDKSPVTAGDELTIQNYLSRQYGSSPKPPNDPHYGWVGDDAEIATWLLADLKPAQGYARRYPTIEKALDAYFAIPAVLADGKTLNTRVAKDKRRDGSGFPSATMDPETRERGSQWLTYINSLNGGKDATGRTYKQYRDVFDASGLYAPKDKFGEANQHGHHIIYKNSPNDGKGDVPTYRHRFAAEGRDILLYYGIDPYYGKENLAYAQNYTHTTRAMEYMAGVLRKMFNDVRPRSVIEAQLVQFADQWTKHTLTGMKTGG